MKIEDVRVKFTEYKTNLNKNKRLTNNKFNPNKAKFEEISRLILELQGQITSAIENNGTAQDNVYRVNNAMSNINKVKLLINGAIENTRPKGNKKYNWSTRNPNGSKFNLHESLDQAFKNRYNEGRQLFMNELTRLNRGTLGEKSNAQKVRNYYGI